MTRRDLILILLAIYVTTMNTIHGLALPYYVHMQNKAKLYSRRFTNTSLRLSPDLDDCHNNDTTNTNTNNNNDETKYSNTFDVSKYNIQDIFTRNKNNNLKDQIRSQYDDETLKALLNAHVKLNEEIESMSMNAKSSDTATSISLSLHELVMRTIGEEEDVVKIPEDLREKATGIRAIATDVDGTLMNAQQYVHPRTLAALRRAIEEASSSNKIIDGVPAPALIRSFFLATGKSRKGALDSLGKEIADLVYLNNIPGVYIQGLYCVDGSGNVIFEKKLTTESIIAAEKLAQSADVAIVSYDGDYLFSTEIREEVIQLSEQYGEPMPHLLPKGDSLTSHTNGIHKILLMDNDIEKLNAIRPTLEKLAEDYDATVTQAIPTMLEFLPGGCSKGRGVAELCNALGIHAATELLALGDAENDTEMMEMAAIGCAVGNASPPARSAADYTITETNDEGGAGAAMELFVFERSL